VPDELSKRLDNIYAAVEGTSADDMDKIKAELQEPAPGEHKPPLVLDIQGEMSDSQIRNAAMTAIRELALFYTYCIPWATQRGISKDEVDKVTANCVALRIARDLDNNEKHPGSKNNTSLVNPILTDIRRVMLLDLSKPGFLFFDPYTAKVESKSVQRVIHGAINNSQTGAYVMDLKTMLEQGTRAWEDFLRTHAAIPAASSGHGGEDTQ
jgi:hypothetical protein